MPFHEFSSLLSMLVFPLHRIGLTALFTIRRLWPVLLGILPLVISGGLCSGWRHGRWKQTH